MPISFYTLIQIKSNNYVLQTQIKNSNDKVPEQKDNHHEIFEILVYKVNIIIRYEENYHPSLLKKIIRYKENYHLSLQKKIIIRYKENCHILLLKINKKK